MADIYNNYLRLRLSDAMLRKESSSKTASSTIPLSAVTHNEGALYSVKSASREDIVYTVDLSIGTCSCISGNTGSVCKHQLAASQHSAVRLPQLYACKPAERQLLFKVMYGDTAMPTSTFFDGLFAATPVNDVAGDEEAAHVEGASGAVSEQVPETPTDTPDNVTPTDEQINEYTSMFNKALKRNKGASTLGSLDVFVKRVKACRNAAQMSTLLRTAGCTLFKRSGAHTRRIHCQPTSIARRSLGQLKGKSALLKGKLVKRKRNLALNISSNVPNAKVH